MSASSDARTVTRLTTLGHSCVMLESRSPGSPTLRVLVDPGDLTATLPSDGPIDAVLITHPHPDHLDPARLARLEWTGEPRIYGGPGVVEVLAEAGVAGAVPIEEGTFSIDGLVVVAFASAHEPIYPGVPVPVNLAFLVAGGILVPGDSFPFLFEPVDTLLVPIGGPWMKLSEAIDFLRRVEPVRAVPIHDGGLAAAHRTLHRALLDKFAPDRTTIHPLDPGQSVDL